MYWIFAGTEKDSIYPFYLVWRAYKISVILIYFTLVNNCNTGVIRSRVASLCGCRRIGTSGYKTFESRDNWVFYCDLIIFWCLRLRVCLEQVDLMMRCDSILMYINSLHALLCPRNLFHFFCFLSLPSIWTGKNASILSFSGCCTRWLVQHSRMTNNCFL